MKGPKPWGGHVLFAVIAGLMAIAVFVGFWWERSVERRLQAHGLTVMGSVEVRDVRPGSSRDKPNQY